MVFLNFMNFSSFSYFKILKIINEWGLYLKNYLFRLECVNECERDGHKAECH